MTTNQHLNSLSLFDTLDELTGLESGLVRDSLRYELGLLLVEQDKVTTIESNGAQLVIEAPYGETVTLPRPDELSPAQEKMVQEHLGWLLQAYLA